MRVQIRAIPYINIKETTPKMHVQILVICTYKKWNFVRTKIARMRCTILGTCTCFFNDFRMYKMYRIACSKGAGRHLKCLLLRIYVDFEWGIRFFIAKKSPPHLAGGSWSICIFLEIFHFFTFFHNFVKTKHRWPIDDGNSAKQQNF